MRHDVGRMGVIVRRCRGGTPRWDDQDPIPVYCPALVTFPGRSRAPFGALGLSSRGGPLPPRSTHGAGARGHVPHDRASADGEAERELCRNLVGTRSLELTIEVVAVTTHTAIQKGDARHRYAALRHCGLRAARGTEEVKVWKASSCGAMPLGSDAERRPPRASRDRSGVYAPIMRGGKHT